MTKKIGDKKLGGVKSTTHTPQIESTQAVTRVTSIQPTTGVGPVKGASAIGKRRATRVLTIEEREELLKLVTEEADKMLSSGILPPQKKELVAQAVKMAVDASLVSEEEAKEEKDRKQKEDKRKAGQEPEDSGKTG